MESISKKILFVVFILTYKQVGIAQVVDTDANYATETDSITVFFDATQGNMGLMDYQGDIWAHTGVITSNSTHSTDWRYVKTNWGENTSETQLISLGGNLWKLNIGFPHEYYGAPNNEQILQLAFVFRNHDGSESGRDVGGADIFLDLFDMGINSAQAQAEVYSYLEMENKMMAAGKAPTHELTMKWLEACADKFSADAEKFAERRGFKLYDEDSLNTKLITGDKENGKQDNQV